MTSWCALETIFRGTRLWVSLLQGSSRLGAEPIFVFDGSFKRPKADCEPQVLHSLTTAIVPNVESVPHCTTNQRSHSQRIDSTSLFGCACVTNVLYAPHPQQPINFVNRITAALFPNSVEAVPLSIFYGQ